MEEEGFKFKSFCNRTRYVVYLGNYPELLNIRFQFQNNLNL